MNEQVTPIITGPRNGEQASFEVEKAVMSRKKEASR